MNKLYVNIKYYREKIGMSQAELARRIGYKSRSAVAKIEAGKSDLPQSKIAAFANALGVTVSDLLDNDNIQAYDENNNRLPLDDETKDILNVLRTRPEMKVLFSVSKKATKEDIEQTVKIIEALRK